MEPQVKLCGNCGSSDYRILGKKKPRRECYPCHRQHAEAWRKRNPEKHNRARFTAEGRERFARYRREWVLRSRYGMTSAGYAALLAAQGNGCAICGGAAARNRMRLPVDHCHATGMIRGILCDDCNIGIAKFKDDPALLTRAIDYLNLAALKAVAAPEPAR